METADIAIIGAGAAGLAAAIFAAEHAKETGRSISIVALEGARKPGAKILVSGGGRCNVTNTQVESRDYNGGPAPVIRNVLRAFNEQSTFSWMKSMGVELKLEPTGKYFPASDSARTVLEALLVRARALGVELRAGARVAGFRRSDEADGFQIAIKEAGTLHAKRVIVATGGLSLPKSGSDGAGLNWMRQLGHTIMATTPALVPLLLESKGEQGNAHGGDSGLDFRVLAGITLPLRLVLVSANGKNLAEHTGSAVFTHFGLSGPVALDISRHVARHMLGTPGPARILIGHPQFRTTEHANSWLLAQAVESPRRLTSSAVGAVYPERLANVIGGDTQKRLNELRREERLELARRLSGMAATVIGNRGYSFAETTAGGVDLREIDVRTMQSRRVPGLFLCGEMLDVDGRIGGFNFQWAWASGYLAGRGAVNSLSG